MIPCRHANQRASSRDQTRPSHGRIQHPARIMYRPVTTLQGDVFEARFASRRINVRSFIVPKNLESEKQTRLRRKKNERIAKGRGIARYMQIRKNEDKKWTKEASFFKKSLFYESVAAHAQVSLNGHQFFLIWPQSG